MTHERYADWDGAYVMGALSRADRQEFEAHLAECPTCRDAVADLGALPGLLGRLSAEDAVPLLGPAEDPPASLTAPPAIALRPRRRTRTRVALGLAAATVAAAVAVPVTLHALDRPTETVTLHQVAASPLSASASLTATSWGTRVDMTCAYARGYAAGEQHYVLDVVDRHGRVRRVSSWHARPGDTVHATGSTDLDMTGIRTVELRDPAGHVLLSSPV